MLLLTTAVASGQEAPEAREIAPGEWRSQRDNPWQVLPDFSVSLSAIEQAERTPRPVSVSDPLSASATWNFEMELWTTVSGTDPFSPDFAPTGERAHTFISVPGVYTGGMVVPFKTEGLFLGYEPTNLRWRKSFAVSSTVADVLWLPDEENWALEEDVEIRAVSIIEAYPEGGAPKLGFARALQLMDGLPPRNVSRQSNGGVIEFLGFQVKDPPELFEFGQRPLRLIRAEGGGTYVAPDDVFSQCGVQFRLASYVAVKVPGDVYEGAVRRLPLDVVVDPSVCTMLPGRPDADDKGDCILEVVEWENNFSGQRTLCGGDTERALDARRDAIELVKEYAKAVPRNNLLTGMTGETGAFEGINVVLMGQIGGGLLTDRCKEPDALFGDVDLGLTDPNSWVAVSTDLAGAQPTTLSHELGHQLLGSYDHVDYTTNLATDLMKEGDGDGFHIPGCQTWQHAFPGLPVGCDPDAVASVEVRNLCEEMRDVVPPPPPPAPARMEPGDPLDFLSRRWTYGRFSWGGATEAVFTDAQTTEGSYAITVPVGYRDIASPSFRTADLPEVGDHLSVDVFIPSPVANPYWVGAVALFVDIPSAGIYNQWISQRDLTPLSRGAWSTLEFALPASIVAALRSDLPAVQLIVATNTGTSGLLVDHLRFTGEVSPQEVEHIEGSLPHDVSLLPMGGFEVLGDWTATPAGGVTLEAVTVLEGQAALELEPGGVRVLESGEFDTAELSGISDVLSIDVFVPNPQPNPWWVGEVQLFASCPSAGVYNQWLGQEALTNLFTDEFNQLHFEVPPAVRQAWEGSSSDCSVSIVLNTNAGAGAFLLDRLGFL